MKDSIRLFVAATLPPEVRHALQEQLQAYVHQTLRFVPPQNLHLTLHFIGNVPVQELPSIEQRIREAAQRHQPFVLDLEQLEPGPTPRQPRLVWARFAKSPAFEALSHNLTSALTQKPAKKQQPIAHVTLARFRKDGSPLPNLSATIPSGPVQLPVQEVALWQSELAAPHPVYSVLKHFPLS